MKQSFILLMLSVLNLVCFGQTKKVTADTFSLSQPLRFSFKSIIIRSDSTYCLREAGCTSSNLSMGFWVKKGDTFFLSGLYYSGVKSRTDILTNEDVDDSTITFQVQDCYGNPISRYFIDLFTKDLLYDSTQTNDNRTDGRGILKVKRNNSVLFTTETDETNSYDMEGEYNDINYRPISQNAKRIIITLSYPKNIQENLSNNFYVYKSRKFKLIGKQLVDIETGYSYVSK